MRKRAVAPFFTIWGLQKLTEGYTYFLLIIASPLSTSYVCPRKIRWLWSKGAWNTVVIFGGFWMKNEKLPLQIYFCILIYSLANISVRKKSTKQPVTKKDSMTEMFHFNICQTIVLNFLFEIGVLKRTPSLVLLFRELKVNHAAFHPQTVFIFNLFWMPTGWKKIIILCKHVRDVVCEQAVLWRGPAHWLTALTRAQ